MLRGHAEFSALLVRHGAIVDREKSCRDMTIYTMLRGSVENRKMAAWRKIADTFAMLGRGLKVSDMGVADRSWVSISVLSPSFLQQCLIEAGAHAQLQSAAIYCNQAIDQGVSPDRHPFVIWVNSVALGLQHAAAARAV